MTEVQEILVPVYEVDDLNDVLTGKTPNEQDGTIAVYTAKFSNGMEADIKVCGVGPTEQWKKEDEATPYMEAFMKNVGNGP